MKPIATKVRLKAYKGPEWGHQAPWTGEENTNSIWKGKADELERLLFELETASRALRRAGKFFRADPTEDARRTLWECRKVWWVAHYRMQAFWDKNPQS